MDRGRGQREDDPVPKLLPLLEDFVGEVVSGEVVDCLGVCGRLCPEPVQEWCHFALQAQVHFPHGDQVPGIDWGQEGRPQQRVQQC